MGFYNDIILPRVCDLAMRNAQLRPYRERVIGAAEGLVIEIGVGSGRNLSLYRSPVKEVLALEPSPQLTAMPVVLGIRACRSDSSKLRQKPFRWRIAALIPL
jgi:hypothetical protein